MLTTIPRLILPLVVCASAVTYAGNSQPGTPQKKQAWTENAGDQTVKVGASRATTASGQVTKIGASRGETASDQITKVGASKHGVKTSTPTPSNTVTNPSPGSGPTAHAPFYVIKRVDQSSPLMTPTGGGKNSQQVKTTAIAPPASAIQANPNRPTRKKKSAASPHKP